MILENELQQGATKNAIALCKKALNEQNLLQVFYLTTLSFVVICFAAVLLAFHRMRRLKFIMEEEDIDEGAELLDRLLLVFGLTGELIFCIGTALPDKVHYLSN